MKVEELEKNWDEFGRKDPYWAVLTETGKEGNRWDQDEFYETGRRGIAALMKRLDALAIAPKGTEALDFGSGAGRLSRALAERFDRVTGVDIAPSMVALAQQNNPLGERLTFLHNPRSDLSLFPNDRFDFVLSFITLQHTSPTLIKSYLREFTRVLRPGGLLVFDLPDVITSTLSFKVRLREAVPAPLLRAYHRLRHGRELPVMHYVGLRPDAVRAILNDAGLNVAASELKNPDDAIPTYLYVATKPG